MARLSILPHSSEHQPDACFLDHQLLHMTHLNTDLAAHLNDAVAAVREHTSMQPEMVLILGSGLGDLAEEAEEATVVPASTIPHYPQSTVAGHDGQLVLGTLGGTDVVFVQGRVHAYEGYPVHRLTFPLQVCHALGAERLLVTNSAGGVNRTFQPGQLMLITNHINLAFADPGQGQQVDPRRAAIEAAQAAGSDTASTLHTGYYDLQWAHEAQAVATKAGVHTAQGTYAWTRGPSYETKAEVRMLGRLGADAVGMSTVPEVLQAHALGMQVLGISTITNFAAGLGHEVLEHDDVLEVGQQVRGDLRTLVRAIVEKT